MSWEHKRGGKLLIEMTLCDRFTNVMTTPTTHGPGKRGNIQYCTTNSSMEVAGAPGEGERRPPASEAAQGSPPRSSKVPAVISNPIKTDEEFEGATQMKIEGKAAEETGVSHVWPSVKFVPPIFNEKTAASSVYIAGKMTYILEGINSDEKIGITLMENGLGYDILNGFIEGSITGDDLKQDKGMFSYIHLVENRLKNKLVVAVAQRRFMDQAGHEGVLRDENKDELIGKAREQQIKVTDFCEKFPTPEMEELVAESRKEMNMKEYNPSQWSHSFRFVDPAMYGHHLANLPSCDLPEKMKKVPAMDVEDST